MVSRLASRGVPSTPQAPPPPSSCATIGRGSPSRCYDSPRRLPLASPYAFPPQAPPLSRPKRRLVDASRCYDSMRWLTVTPTPTFRLLRPSWEEGGPGRVSVATADAVQAAGTYRLERLRRQPGSRLGRDHVGPGLGRIGGGGREISWGEISG